MKAGEYRCPNCLRRDLPGVRFAVKIVGLPMSHGVPWPDVLGDEDQYIYCVKCLRDGVTGLDAKTGLVAVRNKAGWRVLKLE